MPRAAKASKPADSPAALGFEATAVRDSASLQSEVTWQSLRAAKGNGRIYDPACGSGGNPRNSESRSEAETARRRLPAGRAQQGNFIESHGGTGLRDSTPSKSEATLPSLSAAKGNRANISIYGQEKWARRQRPFGLATRARRVRLRGKQPKQSNATTRRLAIMNLALRGIEADFGKEHADTFRVDQHPDLRADYVLAGPPFNDSDWAFSFNAFKLAA